MTVIDDRGRLFGRVNLVDAAVLAFVGMLVPLAYASYLLFRSPPATLAGVEPASLVMGPNPRVRVTGTNLRPFMRVSFDDEQGRTFLIGSTTSAEVDLPQLAPGTYDVVLYDYAQELSRLPDALTVVAPAPAPSGSLVATGRFIGLNREQADALQAGQRFASIGPDSAELLAVGEPVAATARVRSGDGAVNIGLAGQYEVAAALRLGCWFENNPDGSLRCVTAGRTQPATVTRDAVLSLQRGTGDGDYVNFQVDEVFPSAAPVFATVRVRPAGLAPVTDKIARGDRDLGGPVFPDAWIGSVAGVGPGADVTLRLPVQRVGNGWQYRSYPLKAGRGLRFETSSYVIDGTILDVDPPGAPN